MGTQNFRIFDLPSIFGLLALHKFLLNLKPFNFRTVFVIIAFLGVSAGITDYFLLSPKNTIRKSKFSNKIVTGPNLARKGQALSWPSLNRPVRSCLKKLIMDRMLIPKSDSNLISNFRHKCSSIFGIFDLHKCQRNSPSSQN